MPGRQEREGREEVTFIIKGNVFNSREILPHLWQEEIPLHIDFSFREAEVEGKENKTFIFCYFCPSLKSRFKPVSVHCLCREPYAKYLDSKDSSRRTLSQVHLGKVRVRKRLLEVFYHRPQRR